MPRISRACSFKRYFVFFFTPRKICGEMMIQLGRRSASRTSRNLPVRNACRRRWKFRAAISTGRKQAYGRLTSQRLKRYSNGEKGENRVWGGELELIGKHKFLLGWFCMQVQMINLAKKKRLAENDQVSRWCVQCFLSFPPFPKKLHWKLGGGFKYLLFSPLFGEDSHFDEYFSKGLNHQPDEYDLLRNFMPEWNFAKIFCHWSCTLPILGTITYPETAGTLSGWFSTYPPGGICWMYPPTQDSSGK